MSLPNVNATFSMPLPVPPDGHSGKMSQPHWIPIGSQGKGCFVTADESVLYVLDREKNLIWKLNARLAFSGFAVDGKTMYVQDGHVLFRYDLEILQTGIPALPQTMLGGVEGAPQRAYNLVTEQRYSAAPSEGDLRTIYDLVDATDKANSEKLAAARRLRSWVRLIQDADKERRKTQVRLLAVKGDEIYSDQFDVLVNRDLQLAGMIDDARWLLGVDVLTKDRSYKTLFGKIEGRVTQIESDAARLRFTPPVLRQNRDLDSRAVYVMDAAGLVIGLTTSLSEAQGTKNDPPITLEMSIEENPDRSATISYLATAGMVLLKIKDESITKLSSIPTTISPALWIESLALKRSQSPWSKACVEDAEFIVHNVSTPASKNLLFTSIDDRSDTTTLQLVSSLYAFPTAGGAYDFTVPAPNLVGGILFDQKLDMSGPLAAPVHFHPEGDIAFTYAVTYSSFSPTKLLECIDNSPSKWKEFVGNDEASRVKTRENVSSGRIPPPPQTHRSMIWHKIKMQTDVKTEDWQTAWRAAAESAAAYQTSRFTRDGLQVRADQYRTDICGKLPSGFEVSYVEVLEALKNTDIRKQDVPDQVKEACKFLEDHVGISMQTMWDAVLNNRALALAEASLKVAHTSATEALERAAAAYSKSSLWNAWKLAGPQLLKQN